MIKLSLIFLIAHKALFSPFSSFLTLTLHTIYTLNFSLLSLLFFKPYMLQFIDSTFNFFYFWDIRSIIEQSQNKGNLLLWCVLWHSSQFWEFGNSEIFLCFAYFFCSTKPLFSINDESETYTSRNFLSIRAIIKWAHALLMSPKDLKWEK